MITLRLDPALEKNILSMAKQLGISKSELIRISVAEYLERAQHSSPWELGEPVFGKYSSGQEDLSQNRKILLKQKLRQKK